MVLKICIIIPAYNEETAIRQNVELILQYAKELPAMVVVVNDGSKDKTLEILQECAKKYKEGELKIISYPENKGYGGALRTGMQFAIENKYDYALFMDSDLTNHPKYLQPFYEVMTKGCDYIKATRYSKEGGAEGVPWKRRMFSIVGNALASVLFRLPLTDLTNGFRAVKIDVLKKLDLREDRFPIIMEELCQAKKFTKSFCEVPYILTSRQQGQGDTSFPYTFKILAKYLKYALKSFFSI